MDKNTYEIRFCELISASLVIGEEKVLRIDGHLGFEGSEGSEGSKGSEGSEGSKGCGGRPCGNGKW